MDHGLTKMDMMAVRGRMLKSGNGEDLQRMLQRQSKIAFRRFKEGSYQTAARELLDLYETGMKTAEVRGKPPGATFF